MCYLIASYNKQTDFGILYSVNTDMNQSCLAASLGHRAEQD